MSLPDAERERDGESCKNKVTTSFLYFPENPTRPARQAERARLPRYRFFGSFSQTRIAPGFSAAREPLVIDKAPTPRRGRGRSVDGRFLASWRSRGGVDHSSPRAASETVPDRGRKTLVRSAFSAETLFRFRVAESREKNGAFSRGVVVRSGLAGTTSARRRPRDARSSRSEPRWPTPGLSPWVRKAAGVQALPRRYVAKRLGTARPIDFLFPDVPISDTWRFSPRWVRARVATTTGAV